MQPRVLYGLHERFVMLAFARGSRRARLLLRASLVSELCRVIAGGPKPIVMGAPLVLGEILTSSVLISREDILVSGAQIHSMRRLRILEWHLRNYRVAFCGDTLRFEAGSKTIYATHTSYYGREYLIRLCAQKNKTGSPLASVP
jgi:hypothetical protein